MEDERDDAPPLRYGDQYNPATHKYTYAPTPNWLLRRKEVSRGVKDCYSRLLQYAGKDGICYPSEPTLAKEICCSPRQVIRMLQELEDLGLIRKLPGKKGVTNRYAFLWHPWIDGQELCEDVMETAAERKQARRGEPLTPVTGVTYTTGVTQLSWVAVSLSREVVTPVTRTSDTGDQKVVTLVSPKENQLKEQGKDAAALPDPTYEEPVGRSGNAPQNETGENWGMEPIRKTYRVTFEIDIEVAPIAGEDEFATMQRELLQALARNEPALQRFLHGKAIHRITELGDIELCNYIQQDPNGSCYEFLKLTNLPPEVRAYLERGQAMGQLWEYTSDLQGAVSETLAGVDITEVVAAGDW